MDLFKLVEKSIKTEGETIKEKKGRKKKQRQLRKGKETVSIEEYTTVALNKKASLVILRE